MNSSVMSFVFLFVPLSKLTVSEGFLCFIQACVIAALSESTAVTQAIASPLTTFLFLDAQHPKLQSLL